ncbi:fad dependent sulfhydryl oxidase [Diplodia corticola]|uniref:Sulfhydryl oxidase n=1 Tax=Diplodia corticola TaxID=236234 RepID=A0A1J9RSN6_9PEZI|nr:fad dependent sulfhydryl oxidase [Diplodia corticola]OJD30549.1 fad dependent sulfhydryl oxidase [Diplodia corticola]
MSYLDVPILSQFLCVVESRTGMPAQPLDAPSQGSNNSDSDAHADAPKKLPKGVVLGPDGKPCRSCTSVSSWFAMAKEKTKNDSAPTTTTSSSSPAAAATTTAATTFSSSQQPPADCPPDIADLGRSSWTLLHSITGAYPARPSAQLQADTARFVRTFAQLYPCWTCAEDFQRWLAADGNAPRVSSRDEFGRWMCEAHNAVNDKLGKAAFDCDRWEERWYSGWRDGRCDP